MSAALNQWTTGVVVAAGLVITLLNVLGVAERTTGVVTLGVASTILLHLLSEHANQRQERHEAQATGTLHVLENVHQAHLRVASVISEQMARPGSSRVVLHSSAVSRPAQADDDGAVRAYEQSLERCIRSNGPDMWRMRSIRTLRDRAELDELVGQLRGFGRAEGYEVKVFLDLPDGPLLTPLVVGDEFVFLGLEDPRSQCVLQLVHGRAVASMTQYFNDLWGERRGWPLYKGGQLSDVVVRELRQRLPEAESASIVDLREPAADEVRPD